MKYTALIILSFITLVYCTKNEKENNDDKKFYEKNRNIVLLESFDEGLYSLYLDKENYEILGGTAFLQNGPCATSSPGYLNIGCVAPLDETRPEYLERTYKIEYVDTVFDYKSHFDLSSVNSESIAIQIDYFSGGKTELNYRGYRLSSNDDHNNYVGKRLHLFLNSKNGSYEAYLDDENASGDFELITTTFQEDVLIFRVENEILMENGAPYVNLNGMRLDGLEIYTL